MTDLRRSIRTARHRRDRWRRDRETSIGHYLARTGAIGWLVVVPALLGALAGRWLDRELGTGITLTAALLVLGVVVGCAVAWHNLRDREGEP